MRPGGQGGLRRPLVRSGAGAASPARGIVQQGLGAPAADRRGGEPLTTKPMKAGTTEAGPDEAAPAGSGGPMPPPPPPAPAGATGAGAPAAGGGGAQASVVAEVPPPPAAAAATGARAPAAGGGGPQHETELLLPTTPLLQRPRKRTRNDSGPSQLPRSVFELEGPMRGFKFSFKVTFQDPAKRTARVAATEAIKRALCAWGSRQTNGFTLDAREIGACLEGVIEGVDNGVVSERALAALTKRLYDLLGRCKRRSALPSHYKTKVLDAQAMPEEMVRSGIAGKGVRTGHIRWQTTPSRAPVEQMARNAVVPGRS